MLDLRDWLAERERANDLITVRGADWNLEVYNFTHLQVGKGGERSALLFDNIVGYPDGYRVVTRSLDSKERAAALLGLDPGLSDLSLMHACAGKLAELEKNMVNFPPQVVGVGPVCENLDEGADVNLFKFPTPKWNALDGGRYIGTSDAVITRDPETGEVNLGTYRIQIHDERTVGLHISPGHHGRLHYEKHHEKGESCPVAISVGHHPMVHGVSAYAAADGMEYNLLGAMAGESAQVIIDDLTGLPIPASAELVLVGWCPPGETRVEGMFGEWTGYYANDAQPRPIVKVERVYYRNKPIILGLPGRQLSTGACAGELYYRILIESSLIYMDLIRNGIADVRGVWVSSAASQLFITVSLKQRYSGHAKRAAMLASQSRAGAYMGRYIVVVDEDIDPTSIDQVLWAMCLRSDPDKDIDIIRNCWSTPLDPIIRKPSKAWQSSRAIIDACRPIEWRNDFPTVIRMSRETAQGLSTKWPELNFHQPAE